ncbi:hypothetical protein [Aquiflexum sp.]|uniref:hypothetical protein n=1 Tax=Aquiflexum sp. TaxID=1872584 RepID=UPI00359421CD
MKKNLVILSLIAAIGLMLTRQVNAQSSQIRFPFSGTAYFCDEPVDVDGEYHVVLNNVTSKSGNTMFKLHVNAKGSGVGQISGAKYQYNDVSNTTETISKGSSTNFTLSGFLIGQGKAPNYKVKANIHITVNANGEVTAEFLDFSQECK